MDKKIKVSVLFFMLIGIMEGAILSIVASTFMDIMITSYSVSCTLTYIDWLFVLCPCFSLIGALFSVITAIFLYEDEEKNKKNFFGLLSKR